MMGYGAVLVILGVISGEDALVFFGLGLLALSNLHNIAELLRKRSRNHIDDKLKSS